MKGIIFAGDSFTWGQGLYYYSELPNIQIPPPGNYIKEYLTESHKKFKNTKRFARLVANHFETFELVKIDNGGSDQQSLEFIDDVFKSGYIYQDISYVIFQTTQFLRTNFDIVYKGTQYSININEWTKLDKITEDTFVNWLLENNYTMDDYGKLHIKQIFDKWLLENNYTFDDYEKLHKKQIFDKIKNKFKELELNGIKSKIICWTYDYIDFIKNDEYMNDRFIPILYDNKSIDCFEWFMEDYSEMMIVTDPYFKNPIVDHHLSLNAQKIVTNSIINKIK